MSDKINMELATLLVKMAMMLEVELNQDNFKVTEEALLARIADLIGKEQALEQIKAYTNLSN